MNLISSIFILLTGLSSAFASADLICGEFEYDPSQQRCCGGRIHVTPDALDTQFQCCGDDLLSVDGSWQCCGNTKMDVRDDTVCCNGEIINSTTHECCGDPSPGTWQRKHRREEGHECCGILYFDRETQTCCSSNGDPFRHVAEGVGSCCGTQTYNELSEICCPLPSGGMQSHSVGPYGVMLKEVECCGNGWINKTTHICCQGVPQPRGNGPASCNGNQVYDPTRQVICGGGLHDIQNGKTECCSGRLINPNVEPCCSDSVLLQQSPFSCCGYGWKHEREPFDPTEKSCLGDERIAFPEVISAYSVWAKCGETVYADNLFICCDGQLSPKFEDSQCCGSDTYRTNTQFCINDGPTVVDKITPNAQLCTTNGREEDLQYDPETQTCCRETYYSSIWRVFNGTEGECCLVSETEVVLTDPNTQTCCKAHEHHKVHNTPLGEGVCCGPEMVVQGTQLCDWAMQEVVEIPDNHPNHNDVCVPLDRENNNIRQTFDNEREFCSNNGEIIPKAEGKDICWGQIYDTETQSCCSSTIYRLVTHQCCGGYVVQPLVNDEGLPLVCCGLLAYHPQTSACWNGNVIDGIPDKNARLCDSEVYDNSMYDCVNGWELVPHESGPYIKLCGWSKKVYDERLQECCGEELIGQGQTCCFGYVYETPGTALREGSCCGRNGYNPMMHSCCLGTISPIQGMESPACCKHQAYDSSLSNITCCGGRLSRKMPDDTECSVADGVVHRTDEMVCGGVRYPIGHRQCCGSDLYDPSTELCCDGFRYEAEEGSVCCGNKPYNASKEGNLCCEGTVHTQATGKECCNRAAFYPSTHQCFTTGSRKIIIKHFDDAPSTATDAFCTEGSYDVTNQTCCDGLLYNGLRECCGNQVIEPFSDSMCCNSIIQRKLYGDASQCCPSGQIVHESSGCGVQELERGLQLCNGTEFVPLVQGCCAGVVYSFHDAQCRDDRVLHQCGRDLYSRDEQTCCNGSLDDVPNRECCEDVAFDPTSHICCEGIVRRLRKERDQCCGPLVFDTKREVCCEFGPSRMFKRNKRKMPNNCCLKGFQPNFDTGYCEEVPLLCQGLEHHNLWREASEDCSMDFTFRFDARRISVNDTDTVIEMEGFHHLLPHNSNINIDTLVLPANTQCRKLKQGETYVIYSSGDIAGTSLYLRNEDFLGKYRDSILRRLYRRTCL